MRNIMITAVSTILALTTALPVHATEGSTEPGIEEEWIQTEEPASAENQENDDTVILPPMTKKQWDRLSYPVKLLYAQVTLEMLEMKGNYGLCLPDAYAFVDAIQEEHERDPSNGAFLFSISIALAKTC